MTRRLSQSASRSIDAAISRRCAGGQSMSGSMSVPAAARIDASGVRRSCDTESRRADLSASLRREISALVASRWSRSRSSAPPIWSAAAANTRFSPSSGSPSATRSDRPDGAEGLATSSDRDPEGALRALLRGRLCASRRVDPDPFGRVRRPAGGGASNGPRGCPGSGLPAEAVSAATASPTTTHTRVARSSSRSIRAIGARAAAGSRSRGEREAHVEHGERLALPFERGDGAVALQARQPARRRRRRRAGAAGSAIRPGHGP